MSQQRLPGATQPVLVPSPPAPTPRPPIRGPIEEEIQRRLEGIRGGQQKVFGKITALEAEATTLKRSLDTVDFVKELFWPSKSWQLPGKRLLPTIRLREPPRLGSIEYLLGNLKAEARVLMADARQAQTQLVLVQVIPSGFKPPGNGPVADLAVTQSSPARSTKRA